MTFKELNKTYEKPIERIKHMSNKQVALCSIGMFLLLCLCTLIIYPLTNGMPVMGMPKEKNIVQIEVSDTRKSDEVIVTEDPDMIYFARNVVGYLNYSFEKIEAVPEEELFITIRYIENNGTVTEIKANEEYIYWDGEYRKLMQKNVFVTYVEGVFYDGTVVVTRK